MEGGFFMYDHVIDNNLITYVQGDRILCRFITGFIIGVYMKYAIMLLLFFLQYENGFKLVFIFSSIIKA